MLSPIGYVKGKGDSATVQIANMVKVYPAVTLFSIFLLGEPNRKTNHLFSGRYDINNYWDSLVV